MEGEQQNKRQIPGILLLGVGVITAMALSSLFAFFYIPDKTKDANHQQAEIPLQESGYSCKVFVFPSSEEPTGTLDWFSGRAYRPNQVAYEAFEVRGRSVDFQTPIGIKKTIRFDEEISDEFVRLNTKEKRFLLGTDKFGRDVFSRLILGVRVSLMAGFIAVLVSLFIGLVLGCLSGYFGGILDRITMYLINITWSIPTILLVFAIVMALGQGLWVIFLAVGLTLWVDVARIVRGQVLSLKNQLFVHAAIGLGQNSLKIIYKHILPNITGPLLVIISANFATAILIEAGLSYLGFGVNPPTPSLGNMLNENYGYAMTGRPAIALIPAFFIVILVLSFNLVGTGLRDLFDVKE